MWREGCPRPYDHRLAKSSNGKAWRFKVTLIVHLLRVFWQWLGGSPAWNEWEPVSALQVLGHLQENPQASIYF